MPHGHCFLWTPSLLWSYVLSDGVIGLAYYSIPVALWYFVRRRTDLPFSWMFVMFAMFIFACGTTHLVAIWNIWQPIYWLDAAIKIVTASVSLAAAVLVWPLMPRALALPSPSQVEQVNRELTREVTERRRIERDLQNLNQQLEQRVAERTVALQTANQELHRQIDERKQIERSLRESQRLLQAVADNSAAIIWVKDLEGRYLLMHGNYEKLFGLSRSEIIGRTDHELMPAEQADIFRAVDQQAVIARAPVQAEEAAFHDGEARTYLSVKCPLWDDRGEAYALYGISTDITVHKRAEQERTRLAAIVESSDDAILSMALDGTIDSWNRGAEKIYGYAADEIKGSNLSLLVPDDRREELDQLFAQVRLGESVTDYETVRVRKGGDRFSIALTISPLRDATGRIIGISGIGRDLTVRKRAEEELHIAAITFQMQEGIMITDHHARIERVNRAFTQLTGYGADEVVGRTPALLKSGRHDQAFYASMWKTLGDEQYWQGELWNRRKDGQVYPVRMTISSVRAADGQVTRYVASFADITHQKAAEAQLHRLAFYDPLTELPNRRLMLERLRQAFAASARNGQHGAILFIDLDHFKALNDTQGHDIGDQLLTQVAGRLRACVRDDDSVARLGGDEFVVMLEDLGQEQEAAVIRTEVVAEKIRKAIAQPYVIGGHAYESTSSIGIAVFFGHAESVDEMLKRADAALYRAKAAGRNTLQVFGRAGRA
jgi:diguanylate cyclase (GGDEF)-like protein/PAS domain S-box-containing protein